MSIEQNKFRLKKLKLAGFKSFVDPTHVPLPSNLIAVVGPNGCGKSNIIDAVRWVMGESSAKLLRGESMVDVIFSGSTARKPVGQASVELVFDNTAGTLGGVYAEFNEIATKRVVTRDGSSQYYLNGTRCRRKDITDIFLGTGLGPRSYAIIEQGMISRIIEAKPEELRVYFDEAAGISRYKERRRETENRMRNTRENLERLNDIREELGKQLERLQRQAKAAERFKVLRGEQHELKAQLLTLRWQAVHKQLEQQELKIKELQNQHEAHMAEMRHIERQITEQRESHTELQETFNQHQEHYYRIGAQIARLEESIQYQKQRKEQLQTEWQQARADLQAAQAHQQHDQQAITQVQNNLNETAPEAEQQQQRLETLMERLASDEDEKQTWQREWDEFTQLAAQSSQQAHVQQTTIQHIEQRQATLKQRMDRLQIEETQLDVQPVEQELADLQQEQQLLDEQYAEFQHQLERTQHAIQQTRDHISQGTADLDKARSELQQRQGRLSSLEALQQAALGKQSKHTTNWLEQQGLADSLRLAQTIEVESGWEKAVEVLLADHLQAICLDDFRSAADALAQLEQGSISLVNKNVTYDAHAAASADRLASKVTTDWPVAQAMLASVYAVDTLDEALSLTTQLAPHECVVTRDGLCMGNGWLQVKKDADPKAGVLQREMEIKQLAAAIEQQQQQVSEYQQQLSLYREQLNSNEQQHENHRQVVNKLSAQLADGRAKQQVKQARIEQLQQRLQSLADDKLELEQQLSASQQELLEARELWQTAMQAMEDDTQQRERLETRRDTLNQTLDELRHQLKCQRETVHQQELTRQAQQTQLTTLQQNLQRMDDRIEQLTTRCEQLTTVLAEQDTPETDGQQELKEKLAAHTQAEHDFKQARQLLEENEAQLNEFEQNRHQAEQQVQAVQQTLEQARMDGQTYRVQCDHFREQIEQTEYQLETLLDTLPQEAAITHWEQQLSSVDIRIQRLGAINLAAIEEFKTELERKTYLDKQNEDLVKSLGTLEAAIQKIDRESKARFKETFEEVNANFKTLFPRLFGGGHAQLLLTDDDLLNTGISVIAKPPGKQNSRIQLLSGGEKAMTAVALVFAIFQLNPSPFCMLDEVDAPLDDANVARFCNLVKEMSAKVQFIFITHNKVTMELADHLAGVTMSEPGVSRMVSVDMDTAVSLAEA